MPEGEPLATPLMVAADLDGDLREAKVRLAAALSEADLRQWFSGHLKDVPLCAWSKRERMVVARQQLRLGAIALEDRRWATPPEAAVAVAITDGIREAINIKQEKLEQHFPDLSSLNIVLTVEKHQQTAEVTTHFLGQDFSAKASNDDLYQSINEMATKLTSLLQRQKEKVKSHSHQRPRIQEETVEEDLPDEL